jgi:NADP-dependent 3-hydroxy acid dehydrogenase YdfG
LSARVSNEPVLTGRTALVTGASRGIGRSVVEALANIGARVWCVSRSVDALRSLVADIGGEALVADLTDDASTWEALDGMMDTIGGAPDVVVNAAGVFGLASVATETVAAFDAALAVNLRAPFLVNRVVLPGMLERRSGLIVNIGSVAGRRAFPDNAAYSASKFGLRGYHGVLLEELKGTGVRATLLEPSATDTPLWDPMDPDSNPALPDRAQMLAPADVAAAVVFLATRPDTVRIPLLQIERA